MKKQEITLQEKKKINTYVISNARRHWNENLQTMKQDFENLLERWKHDENIQADFKRLPDSPIKKQPNYAEDYLNVLKELEFTEYKLTYQEKGRKKLEDYIKKIITAEKDANDYDHKDAFAKYIPDNCLNICTFNTNMLAGFYNKLKNNSSYTINDIELVFSNLDDIFSETLAKNNSSKHAPPAKTDSYHKQAYQQLQKICSTYIRFSRKGCEIKNLLNTYFKTPSTNYNLATLVINALNVKNINFATIIMKHIANYRLAINQNDYNKIVAHKNRSSELQLLCIQPKMTIKKNNEHRLFYSPDKRNQLYIRNRNNSPSSEEIKRYSHTV